MPIAYFICLGSLECGLTASTTLHFFLRTTFDFQAYTLIKRRSVYALIHKLIQSFIRVFRATTLQPGAMTTPDNLLALAAKLAKLGDELTAVGGRLAMAAAELEQEAANLAEERAKRWGFEVQVAVGVKGGPGAGGNNDTSVVEVKR